MRGRPVSNPAAIIPPLQWQVKITECLCTAVILPHAPRGFQDGNRSLLQNGAKKSDLPSLSEQPATAAALGRHKGKGHREVLSNLTSHRLQRGSQPGQQTQLPPFCRWRTAAPTACGPASTDPCWNQSCAKAGGRVLVPAPSLHALWVQPR